MAITDQVSGGSPGSENAPIYNIMMESLTISTLNTFPALTYAYEPGSFQLIVNGYSFAPVGASPPFSVSGSAITWSSSIYSVLPGDSVVAVYSYTGV
jgi:hypothetical protein